jgi:hypothetical protein
MFEQREKGDNMKNSATAAAITSGTSDGNLKLRMPRSRWHLASNGNPRVYGALPRLNNGPARCQLRKPLKKYLKIKPTIGERMKTD